MKFSFEVSDDVLPIVVSALVLGALLFLVGQCQYNAITINRNNQKVEVVP